MDSVVERLVVAVGFKVDTGSVRSALQGYATVAAGMAAATAAAVGFTISQAAVDDEITKTARDLGITTEAYTALAYAMDREGVASQGMGNSLRYLQTQLEAAARGSGEARSWFERFGIDATDSLGRVRLAADVLPELGDELAKLSDGDLRAASLRTLGESGQRMGIALAKGGDNIRALVADAQTLGLTLDTEAGEAAEKLTDSVTRLQGAGTGLSRIVSQRLTPVVTELVDGLTDWLTESDNIVRVGLERTADAMAWALEGMTTPLGQVVTGLGALGVAAALPSMVSSVPIIGGFVTAIAGVSAPVWGTVAAVGAAVLVLDDLYVASQGGDSALMELAASMGYATEASDALDASIEKTSDAVDLLSSAGRAWTSVAEYMWPDGWMSTVKSFASEALSLQKYLLSWILPIDQISYGLGVIFDRLTDFKGMTGVLDRFADYMSSDAAFNLDVAGNVLGEAVGNTADWFMANQRITPTSAMDSLRTGVSQLPVSSSFSPTNNIQTDVAITAADARGAARQAADAVEREVLGAFATSQVPL